MIEQRLQNLTLAQRQLLAERLDELSDGAGSRQLVAWYTSAEACDERQLRRQLQGRLPSAAMPKRFHHVNKLPRTSTGKIDRRALSVPDAKRQTGIEDAYQSATERALAGVWAQVLGTSDFDRNRPFLEVGGDSLDVIKVVALCQEAGLNVTPALMGAFPSFEELLREIDESVVEDVAAVTDVAAVVETDSGDGDNSVDFKRAVDGEQIEGPICLSRDGSRPKLFLLPPHGNEINQFWQLTSHFQHYTGFAPFVPAKDVMDSWTVDQVVEEFLRQMKSVQPDGPYRLMGYCDGAYAAWEIARRLKESGQEVVFLGNIDSPNPDALQVVSESPFKKLRRRIRSIETRSPIAFARRFGQICLDWLQRRIRSRVTGERHIVRGGSRISWMFRPESYDGHLVLFRVGYDPVQVMTVDECYGWAELCSTMDVITVTGNRAGENEDGYFLDPPHAELMAQKIEAAVQFCEATAQI